MKKFFLKALYLIPLLLFLLYLEYNLSKIPNSYSYKRDCFENQLDSIEVLVLGNSHAANGVNPEYLSLKGFNLSNYSQHLFQDTRLTLKYIDRMPKLKYVIINITYISFNNQLVDNVEAWRDYYYYQFWDIDFPELEKFDLKKFSKIFLYTPQTAFAYFKQGFHVDLAKDIKHNGYMKYDTVNNSSRISDSLGHQRVLFHDRFYKESRFEENQKDLELLISELERRNISPVIVTPPVLSSYYKFINKTRLKKNQDAINAICLKYKCNYYNYFTDSRFVQRDFGDNDHLNFIGAEKFTKILNDEILEKNKTTSSVKDSYTIMVSK
jgi:hypothetical protein